MAKKLQKKVVLKQEMSGNNVRYKVTMLFNVTTPLIGIVYAENMPSSPQGLAY